MNCRKVSHLLSAYMDGELPGVESLQIRDHLNRCSDCATEYEDLLGMKRLVGRLRLQKPRQELVSSILQNIRIDEELRTQQGPGSWLHHFYETLRTTMISPQALGVGVGLAALAILFVAQPSNYAGNRVPVDGNWDQSLPATKDYMSGVNTSALNRFIPPARPTNLYGPQREEFPAGVAFRGSFEPSPSSTSLQTVWHPH